MFIHKILIFSTCFEPQVLIFRRIQLYACSIWYCHSLWKFLVACRYTAWDRLYTYNVILRSVRVTIVAVEKQYVLHTYSECVSVALVIQHEMRMRRIILSSPFYVAVPSFSLLSQKTPWFSEKLIENNVRLIYTTNFTEIFPILRRRERYRIINVQRSSFTLPIILVRF